VRAALYFQRAIKSFTAIALNLFFQSFKRRPATLADLRFLTIGRVTAKAVTIALSVE
jgi:hypothetical protein